MRFKATLLWVTVFVAHAIAQFFAWSIADSTLAKGRLALAFANAVMFPAFWLVGSLADRWFWITFILNSALWASAAMWLMRRLALRGKPTPT
jgi:hypothetical protein